MSSDDPWPALPYEEWAETCATLHRFTQVAGKVRLAVTPWLNHSWHVPLYVTARGLTTSPMPHGSRIFQISFDFIDDRLLIDTAEGARETLPLEPQPVADFHDAVMAALHRLDLPVRINPQPSEIPDAAPLDQDRDHAAYDEHAVRRFHRALTSADRVLKRFRTRFLGKASSVHFFWGSFDLAVTRFSGRPAPPHPGGIPALPDPVTREAYSHEVSSAGFWPGGVGQDAAFYCYAYPEPPVFRTAPIRPESAHYSQDLGEYLLPYEAVRTAPDPDALLLEFLQSTYEAAADAAGWDRAALEGPEGRPGEPRPV